MGTRARARKEWRSFEISVARLEGLLRLAGYTFKSPDKLIDHDTGELREVDCSITHSETGQIVSMECRRRAKRQDVLWIEQLVCKRDSLGLAGTIAVASNGFSRAARLKAERRGIILKTYGEIASPTFLADTANGLQIRHFIRRGKIRPETLSYEIYGEQELDPVEEGLVVAALSSVAGDAVLLRDTVSGQDITLLKLIASCLDQVTGLTVGKSSRNCRFEFQPNATALAPITRPIWVSRLSFVLDIEVAVAPMLEPTLFRYGGVTGAQLDVASAKVDSVERGPMRLSVVFTTEGS
jgi:hypothetical protein